MSIIEQVDMLKQINDERDETILLAFLDMARAVVLEQRYPYTDYDPDEEVPERYKRIQVRIASEMLNKRGAEGEIQHNENGTARIYGSEDVSQSLLRKITPMAKVL